MGQAIISAARELHQLPDAIRGMEWSDFLALQESYQDCPPLASMVAAYLQIKPRRSTFVRSTAAEIRAAAQAAGGVKVAGR